MPAIVALAVLAGAWAGQWLAIAFEARWIALVAIATYGLGFALLAWTRLRWAVIALVVAVPLVSVEVGLGDVEKTVSSDKVALSAVAGVWLLRRSLVVIRSLVQLSSVRWWVAFLAVVVLSALGRGMSIGELWGLSEIAVYCVVFCAALDVFGQRRANLRLTLVATGLAAGVVAALGGLEAAFRLLGEGLPLYFKQGTMPGGGSLGSSIGHANFLGAYLVMTVPVLAALSAVQRAPWRRWTVPSGAIAVVLVGYVRSMGAMTGLAAAGLLGAVLVVRQARSTMAKGGVLVLVVAALAVGGAIAANKLAQSVNPISVRVATLRIGLAAVSERPILGFGRNGYARESSRIEQALFHRTLREFHRPDQPLSAHSSYLDIAVERGLLGLVAFCGILAAVGVAGVRGYRRTADPEQRMLIAGVGAGLIAFAVQTLTENLFNYSKVAAIFWILAAALVRLSEAEPPGPS